jgi:hypothetical protein
MKALLPGSKYRFRTLVVDTDQMLKPLRKIVTTDRLILSLKTRATDTR